MGVVVTECNPTGKSITRGQTFVKNPAALGATVALHPGTNDATMGRQETNVWATAVLFVMILAGVLLATGEVWLRLRRQPMLATPSDVLQPITASLEWSDVKNDIRLVALGDSIVHGHNVPTEAAWPTQLEARLRERYPDAPWKVINSGICGETAVQGLARLKRDALRFGPHVLFIAFGLNDCYLARSEFDAWRERETFPSQHFGPLGGSRLYRALRRELRGEEPPPSTQMNAALRPRVGPEAFSAALQRMIRAAQRAGVPHIYLVTMTPVDEGAHAYWPPELQAQQMAVYHQYNHHVRETAAALDVELIDAEAGFAGRGLAEMLAYDGIHLTAAGQEQLAGIIFTALEQDGTLVSLRQP